jgi:hypothetical protein
MLILEKEVFPQHIEWKVQQSDPTSNNWIDIGVMIVEHERMISILAGLKQFPVELRKKIFSQLVTTAFQEQLTLNQVTQQINIEYEAENNRFVNNEVNDFLLFLREVGI